MRRILLALSLSLGLALGVSACATPAEPVALADDVIVIDVRTPGEFAGGHLEGALNIDVQSADFDTQIAQLDRQFGSTRSINASAAAAVVMHEWVRVHARAGEHPESRS